MLQGFFNSYSMYKNICQIQASIQAKANIWYKALDIHMGHKLQVCLYNQGI